MAYVLHIITMGSLFTLGSLGFNVIFGKGKILHFGPVALSLLSVYAVFLTLKWTGSYASAIAVGLVANLLISSLFAWLSLRLDGDAFGILSIALHLSALAVVLNWTSLTNGALGVSHIPRMHGLGSAGAFAALTTFILLAYIFLVQWITNGPTGRALTALAENRAHAEALGVGPVRATFVAFIVGGFGPLLTGIFYPQYIGLLHPNDYLFPVLIFNIMCVVAGGPGSVRGTVIATIVIVLLQEAIRFLPLPLSALGPVRLLLFGLILLFAVYLRRETLFPTQRRV